MVDLKGNTLSRRCTLAAVREQEGRWCTHDVMLSHLDRGSDPCPRIAFAPVKSCGMIDALLVAIRFGLDPKHRKPLNF